MDVVDFRKSLKHLYAPPANKVVVVDVPPMNFLMVDGKGDPNTSQAYAEAVDALYGLSYTLKFAAKRGELAIDYGVLPLEGLWWADDMAAFGDAEREQWRWTMMIMQPDFITAEMIADASAEVRRKRDPAALDSVRFESFAEGVVAQTMHIGPFSAEAPTIQRVHDFIGESGHTLRGKHHEIYLSDIRRAKPEKWRTVIRQPMA